MPLKQQLFLFEPPYLSSWSDIPGWLETVILKHECYYETRGPQNIISLPSRWIIQVTSQLEYLLKLSLMQCFCNANFCTLHSTSFNQPSAFASLSAWSISQ